MAVKPKRVIIDTNLWISFLITKDFQPGTPAQTVTPIGNGNSLPENSVSSGISY